MQQKIVRSKKNVKDTLTTRIYDNLKNSIIQHDIKPNQRIYERDIASKFGVSKTPVREAILKLSTDGFIQITKDGHALVKEASYEEFLDMAEVITLLDTHISKKAIELISEEKIKKIEDLTKKMAEYCSPETIGEYLEVMNQTHIIIWESIENRELYNLIRDYFEKFTHNHKYVLYSQWSAHCSYLNRSLRKHKKILEALKKRDKALLYRLSKTHWDCC